MSKNIRIQRILLVNIGAIGDVILTTPAISSLRSKFPDAWIATLQRPYTQELLQNNPAVSEILYHPYIEKDCKRDWDNLKQFVTWLKELKLDAIIFFNYFHSSQLLAALLARIPVRIGNSSKILNNIFYTERTYLKERNLLRHEVELYHELLRPLGVNDKPGLLSIYPEAAQEQKAMGIISEANIVPEDVVVGVQLATGGGNRAWLPEKYAEFLNILSTRFKIKCIIGGTKSDASLIERVKKVCDVPILDVSGKLTLKEFAALIKRCNLFVSVDTGPFHTATALRIPMVALFPSKPVRPLRWGPRGVRHIALKKSLHCRQLNCGGGGCELKDCVEALTPELVADAATEVLQGGGYEKPAEVLRHWFFLSVTLMFIIQKKDVLDMKITDAISALLDSGLQAVFIVENNADIPDGWKAKALAFMEMKNNFSYGKKTLDYFAEIVQTYDINVIQTFSTKDKWFYRVLAFVLGLKVAIPPLTVSIDDLNLECEDLLDNYFRLFNKI